MPVPYLEQDEVMEAGAATKGRLRIWRLMLLPRICSGYRGWYLYIGLVEDAELVLRPRRMLCPRDRFSWWSKGAVSKGR
jgi:hypothetical protein